MLLPIAATFDRLVALTAPGAPVAPVITALGDAASALETNRPALVAAHLSEWMLGEVDRVQGAAKTLGDALAGLAEHDGMTKFDAAFAADDASWDATFVEFADVLRRAQGVLDARAGQSAITSATSV